MVRIARHGGSDEVVGRACEEREGERYLSHHQALHETPPRPAAFTGRASFEAGGEIHFGRSQGRREPEKYARKQRNRQREAKDPGIGRDVQRHGSRSGGNGSNEHGHAPVGEKYPPDASHHSQECAFRQQLPHEPRASGPSARRMEISFSRAAARDSSRFATLAQAITSTNATAASTTCNGRE